jgi:hypothetical protein
MFDWHQLQRWGIGEDRLPPGSIIRFRELTFWQQYKGRIAGTATVVVLQAILIGALLVQRKQAKRRAAALAEAQRVLQESEERFRRVFEEGIWSRPSRKDYRFERLTALFVEWWITTRWNWFCCRLSISHPDDVRADVHLAEQLFKREILSTAFKRYVKSVKSSGPI